MLLNIALLLIFIKQSNNVCDNFRSKDFKGLGCIVKKMCKSNVSTIPVQNQILL